MLQLLSSLSQPYSRTICSERWFAGFHTGGDGTVKQTDLLARQDICPSFCTDLHRACSSVIWSDSVAHLYKQSDKFCEEVLDLRVVGSHLSWLGVADSTDAERVCTATSKPEDVHCVSAGSHRATGAVATLVCTFTILAAVFSGKIHINFIPPASILLFIGFFLGMIIKEIIAPVEQSVTQTHSFTDMVEFHSNIFSFMLLPLIIFCSSFNMEHHASVFFHLYIKQITFFAVLGTILAILFTGSCIFAINKHVIEGGMLAYEMKFEVTSHLPMLPNFHRCCVPFLLTFASMLLNNELTTTARLFRKQ